MGRAKASGQGVAADHDPGVAGASSNRPWCQDRR